MKPTAKLIGRLWLYGIALVLLIFVLQQHVTIYQYYGPDDDQGVSVNWHWFEDPLDRGVPIVRLGTSEFTYLFIWIWIVIALGIIALILREQSSPTP